MTEDVDWLIRDLRSIALSRILTVSPLMLTDAADALTRLQERARVLEAGAWIPIKDGPTWLHGWLWSPKNGDRVDRAAGSARDVLAADGYTHFHPLIPPARPSGDQQ